MPRNREDREGRVPGDLPMRDSLPLGRLSQTGVSLLVIWLLLLSMLAVALAPLLMPDSYSWLVNTISESGGQGVHGAWVTRSGFLLTAIAVLLMCSIASTRWGYWGRAAMRLYAFGLISGAIFAKASWEDVPHDLVEAFLHTLSVFWGGVGFALGILVVSYRRRHPGRWRRGFDLAIVLATPIVPLLMLVFAGHAGLLQRGLALAGYIWLLIEAFRLMRARPAG
ncbi:MAG: DUF998 domain-containing protein [Acidimicrobiia bacterium]